MEIQGVEKLNDFNFKKRYRGYTIYAKKESIQWRVYFAPMPPKWDNSDAGAVICYDSPEEAIDAGIRTIDALLGE